MMRPFVLLLLMSATSLSTPVSAQAPLETRVDRIEKELRAVQRKVFPGGVGAIVQPEITTPEVQAPVPGSPSQSPVADLTARVTAIESQLATMTGQIEQTQFRMRQLEQDFAAFKAASAPPPEADPATGEPGSETASGGEASAPANVAATPAPTTVAAKPATSPTAAAPKPPAAKPAPAKPAAAAPSAAALEARKAAVAAIEVPSSGNAAEDAYTYGFRLWNAKFFPEAQVQLKSTLEKYGSTAVASRAANLLGRAYLDDGKPALASVAFYENYQKRPKGDRAAESLIWLGEALIQLKKPADACRVFAEAQEVYGAALTAGQRGMVEKGRATAKCGA